MPGFLRILLLLVMPVGCTGSLPLSAFHEGRYPAAAETLRELESESRAYPPAERARYALYRGLVHLALGDAESADRWLVVAKRARDQHPEWFDAREKGSLLSAWRSMGRMPGDAH